MLGAVPWGSDICTSCCVHWKTALVLVQHFVMQPPKVIPCQVINLILKAQHLPPCKEILMCTLHLFVTVQLLHEEN